MKLLVNTADRGNIWECISINRNEMQIQHNEGIIYEIFSWSVYEAIVLALNEGKQVFIPKNLEGQLEISDLIIDVPDNLEREKRIAIIKMKDIIYNTRLNKSSLIDFFEFSMLNNWFASKGIFITDENREEKYLEIISSISEIENETESDHAINKLERYLDMVDKLQELPDYINSLNSFTDRVNSADNIETINDIFNEFALVFS